jgi:hypothetical protein
MKTKRVRCVFLISRLLGATAAYLLICGVLITPLRASSPLSHIIIAEHVMDRILSDPNANPELRAILSDPAAQRAFSGGACAPDLDTLSDRSHAEDPKGMADQLMQIARMHMREAQKELAQAKTPGQRALAQASIQQANCDIAFAYGWRAHAAADFETHPTVNASGNDYWEDSDFIDKGLHGEWEAMQEANWIEKYGWPRDPNVDYRPDLLEESFALSDLDFATDVTVLAVKIAGAEAVGDRYSDEQLEAWQPINDAIGERSIDRGFDFVNDPNNPLDNSCWDIGLGISLDDFQQFIEDTKRANGGKLPDGFWVIYDVLFDTWRSTRSGGGSSGGGGASGSWGEPAGTPPPLLPPPLTGGTQGAGGGQSGGGGKRSGGAPKLDAF